MCSVFVSQFYQRSRIKDPVRRSAVACGTFVATRMSDGGSAGKAQNDQEQIN
jgi:hypothetical protein